MTRRIGQKCNCFSRARDAKRQVSKALRMEPRRVGIIISKSWLCPVHGSMEIEWARL